MSELTLTRSTLVKFPASNPACNSTTEASYKSGKTLLLLSAIERDSKVTVYTVMVVTV